jgi:signal transduction histidine kinase
MTLRRKMVYQIAAMIVGLLLVSGAALWGLNELHEDYGSALEGYKQLRQVFEVGSHLSTAQALLSLPRPQPVEALDQMQKALHRFDAFSAAPLSEARNAEVEAAIGLSLNQAIEQLSANPPQLPDQAIAQAQWDVATLAAGIRQMTEASRRAAIAKRRATALAVATLAAAVVIAGIGLGVLQYRAVMRPLARLTEGVRRISARQFGRMQSDGGDEFAELARQFNRMSGELDELYRDLEQKVAAKSKALVRSERLAGVGMLAAGVAHEINNPLGVISGYAEYSLSQLQDSPQPAPAGGNGLELKKSLQVICDEAFRCKEITGKLLSLARPGDDTRQVVSLPLLAREVVSVVGGLRQYRQRRVVVQTLADDGLDVSAVEGEMKQVLLNLTVNALEAVADGSGEVQLQIGRRDAWVEMVVADNGRGMSQETLERVFEPFFTDKRGPRQHGTGLGLSITHAIVEAHGGQIEAHSDGPGKGSRFIVRLPAAGDAGHEPAT